MGQRLHPHSARMALPFRRIVTYDAGDHAEQFGGWDHEYRQLAPGAFIGEIREAGINGIHVQRELLNTSAEQTGVVASGTVTFVTFAPQADKCYIDGVRLASDLVYVGGVHELHAVSSGVTDAILVTLPISLLAAAAPPEADRSIERLEARQRIWQPPIGDLQRFRQATTEMLQHLETQPGMLDNAAIRETLYEELITSLLDVAPFERDQDRPSVKSTTRGYIVEWARSFIREHIDENITIGRLCEEGRICRRTLQYSFEDVLGISPARYLLAVRLNGVRRDLQRSGGDVLLQDAAARWGFWHMGRFAGQYRDFFGELPSHTLRSAATRPPSRNRTHRPVFS